MKREEVDGKDSVEICCDEPVTDVYDVSDKNVLSRRETASRRKKTTLVVLFWGRGLGVARDATSKAEIKGP